ncbi:MAG: hypothetical protein ACLQGJ_11515 [Candidatus Dormibacteria bacterium]
MLSVVAVHAGTALLADAVAEGWGVAVTAVRVGLTGFGLTEVEPHPPAIRAARKSIDRRRFLMSADS